MPILVTGSSGLALLMMASLLGIEDAGNACLDIENRINDSISPVPDYRISVDDDTNVITLEVKEGIYKPYYYRSKAYKRNDTATIEVDRLELNRLILEGEDRSYDELASDVKDLRVFTILEGKMKEQLRYQCYQYRYTQDYRSTWCRREIQ